MDEPGKLPKPIISNDKASPDEISNLASEILHHKRLYYAGNPKISDFAYDRLEDRLREIDPDHPILSLVGSDASAPESSKGKHLRPMLSLAKTYDIAELHRWMDQRPSVATYKVDGNSLSLIYSQGKLVEAKTRGNGKLGEIVTDKIRWVSECRHRLLQPFDCEVRGELYCDEKGFSTIHHEMVALGLEEPTNPRNIVAGILGRKKHVELARHFRFFAFEIFVDSLTFQSERERMRWLATQGFSLPPYQFLRDERDIEGFLEQASRHIEAGEYAIDGIVITYDDLELHRALGFTSHHPRYKISFKWQGELAVSRIQRIHWATSRLGVVTPVAVIEPVFLSGATITNVTLHNALLVKELNLKPGDRIEVIRSGEVIPKLERVVEHGPGSHELPVQCPSCATKLEFDEVRLVCRNKSGCTAQTVGQILNWIRCAEIDDISEKRLEAMLESGLVKKARDLYLLTKEDLMQLPATREKMAGKLVSNIQSRRRLPLSHFLAGLGIFGMGINSWESLVRHFPNLTAIQNLTPEKIAALDGFAEKTAQAVVLGLREKTADIEELLEVGVEPFTEATTNEDQTLDQMVFVITGSLSRPRTEIVREIEKRGGKVTGSVSKHTTALITNEGDSSSSKLVKAKQLGIPTWSEEALFAKITGHPPKAKLK